jgi:hypothetical protein
MNDICPNCGGEVPDDDFDKVADHARDEVFALGKRIVEARAQWNIDHDGFCQAMLCGLLAGVVEVGLLLVKPTERDDLMQFLSDYLPEAREIVEGGGGEDSLEATLQ